MVPRAAIPQPRDENGRFAQLQDTPPLKKSVRNTCFLSDNSSSPTVASTSDSTAVRSDTIVLSNASNVTRNPDRNTHVHVDPSPTCPSGRLVSLLLPPFAQSSIIRTTEQSCSNRTTAQYSRNTTTAQSATNSTAGQSSRNTTTPQSASNRSTGQCTNNRNTGQSSRPTHTVTPSASQLTLGRGTHNPFSSQGSGTASDTQNFAPGMLLINCM